MSGQQAALAALTGHIWKKRTLKATVSSCSDDPYIFYASDPRGKDLYGHKFLSTPPPLLLPQVAAPAVDPLAKRKRRGKWMLC